MNTTKRKHKCYICILLFLLLASHHEAFHLCSELPPENCIKVECSTPGFQLECSTLADKYVRLPLQLTVRKGDYAKLKCNNEDADYNWLNGTVIGTVRTLAIEHCQLPSSLGSFLSSFNISGIKTLRIDNAAINFTLDDEYFMGLENITHLLMPNNNFSTLPQKIFEKMLYLTNLDLQNNNLNLKNNLLSSLINLKILELGNNNIQTIIPGLFENMKKLDLLNLWGNSIMNLTKETFNNLQNLSSLDISSNQITYLDADVFYFLENLRTLHFSKNDFTYLPEGIFSQNQRLEVVKLHYNPKFQQVPNKLFAHHLLLREIDLSNCNISILPQDILWETPNISKIDISRNSIMSVPELLFRDTVKLKILDLSDNQIDILSENVFSTLTSLEILHLERNKLTKINEQFHKLGNLKSLHLNNNNIKDVHIYAFQEMDNLEFFNLSHNSLTFQPKWIFSNDISSPLQKNIKLKVLDLSYNDISEIFNDWMWILINLQSLDLSHNNFTQINDQDLQFLQKTKLYVNLQSNKITDINLRFLEAILSYQGNSSELITIDLRGNKLICGCSLYSLLKYKDKRMNESVYNKIKLLIEGLICEAPPLLSGLQVTSLHSTTFKCSLKDEKLCPQQCSCQIWQEKKQYIVNCAGAGLTELPGDLSSLDQIKYPITLILNNNSLNSLPRETLRERNITELSLSYNNINWIDELSLPKSLQLLKLDNNKMTNLNYTFLEAITNRTNITLHNNPWSCDCESADLLNFLHANFKQVENLGNVTCADGRIFEQITTDEICIFSKMIIIAASTTIAVMGIIIGLLTALFFYYQKEIKVWLYAHNMCLWFVREEELDEDKIYDAFISYSHQDEDFVASKLLPNLENGTPSYKICIHYRDWVVGDFITTQITRSVQDSKRTIIILSKNFVKSEWGRLEFRAAHKQALTEKRPKVIVIIYGDLGPLDDLDCELQTYLRTNTYVEWGDPWFWKKLRYALPHSKSQETISKVDKMELINSPAGTKATTPPAGITINPLEVIDNFSNKKVVY